jgi:hypothetical protein
MLARMLPRSAPAVLTWLALIALAGCGPGYAERSETARPTSAGDEREPDTDARVPTSDAESTEAVAPSPEPTCVDPEAEREPSCEGVAAPTRTLQQLRDDDAARRRARSAERPRSIDEPPGPLDPDAAARAAELRAHLCAMPAGDPERPSVLYQLARVHYDALDVATAAPMFDRVAAGPRGELTTYATDLALDSLVLRMRQGVGPSAAAECESRMRAIVDRALATSCAPEPVSEEHCERMAAIRLQLDARAR